MQKKFLLLADYNLSSVLPLTFLKKEREIFFLLLSLPVPQPHMPILKWKDMGRLRERKRTLRKRNPQGPKNPVSILLFLMLSAKIIICQQQKCGLQEHVCYCKTSFSSWQILFFSPPLLILPLNKNRKKAT